MKNKQFVQPAANTKLDQMYMEKIQEYRPILHVFGKKQNIGKGRLPRATCTVVNPQEAGLDNDRSVSGSEVRIDGAKHGNADAANKDCS